MTQSDQASGVTVFGGLRVLDLTHGFAGALATMLLADNGASVTRVEAPHGSAYRGDPSGAAAGNVQWHRSKARLAADLGTPADRAKVAKLAASADVLVESFRPGTLDRLSLGWEELSESNPGLVFCSITGFGTHPDLRVLPGYEGIVMARAGRMMDFANVFSTNRPIFTSSPSASFGAAMGAVQGICAALHVRQDTGEGQRVETSLLQGLTGYDMFGWLFAQMRARDPDAPVASTYAQWAHRPPMQYIPARTADGQWIQFANWADHLFWAQAELLGLGGLRDDPELAALPNGGSEEAKIRFWHKVLDRVSERTLAEWMGDVLAAGNVGADVFGTVEAGMDHPQARFNGDVVALTDARLGATEQIGPLVRFSATPSQIGAVSPWRSGERPAHGTVNRAPSTRGPLGDVVVVEAAAQYAAPFGPTLLADLGARVIKLEPIGGDPFRGNGVGKTLQGKESVELDLKQPEAQAIVHRLARRADLFIHNYRPGVPERLGIDYATLRRENERLVYLYAGAYGDRGPYSHLPAYHPIAGAITGLAGRQAGAGSPPAADALIDTDTVRDTSLRLWHANEGNPDPTSALVVATALLLGLVARDRHGVGQEMLTTMLCSNAYAASDAWIRFDGKPHSFEVDSDLFGLSALYRLYETGDGWIFLACTNDTEWARLRDAVGSDLSDTRFTTTAGRAEADSEIAGLLTHVFSTRSADEWERDLLSEGVACVRADRCDFGTYMDTEPAVRESGFITDVSDESFGDFWRHSAIVSLSGCPVAARAARPAGADTRAVLQELGFEVSEIEDLDQRGVIHCHE